jgi:hypothetical protein
VLALRREFRDHRFLRAAWHEAFRIELVAVHADVVGCVQKAIENLDAGSLHVAERHRFVGVEVAVLVAQREETVAAREIQVAVVADGEVPARAGSFVDDHRGEAGGQRQVVGGGRGGRGTGDDTHGDGHTNYPSERLRPHAKFSCGVGRRHAPGGDAGTHFRRDPSPGRDTAGERAAAQRSVKFASISGRQRSRTRDRNAS